MISNRTTLIILLALALPALTFGGSFTFESDTEISGVGDFDNDGKEDVAIIDKPTGLVRVGYGLDNDDFDFSRRPQASGVGEVSGMALGKLAATDSDSIAVVGLYGNRVQIIPLGNPTFDPLRTTNTYDVGQTSIAAVDIVGTGNTAHDDLFVTCKDLGGTSNKRLRSLRNNGITLPTIQSLNGTKPRYALNPVMIEQLGQDYIGLLEDSGANTFLNIRTAENSSTLFASALMNNSGGRFIYGFFDSAYAYFFGYHPASNVIKAQHLDSFDGFFIDFVGSSTTTFAANIQQMLLVENRGILIIYEGGTVAELYDYSAFGGFSLDETIDLSALGGQVIRNASALPSGKFILHTGNASSTSATNFTSFKHNGSNFEAVASGSMPAISPLMAGGNFFAFNAHPLLDENALLLSTQRVLDWTVGGDFPNAQSLTFRGDTLGLGDQATLSAGPNPTGTTVIAANQFHDSISISSLDQIFGETGHQFALSPPPGSYPTSVELTMSSPTGAFVRYRTNPNAPFIVYNGIPLHLLEDTDFEIHGNFGLVPGAIKRVSYRITTPPGEIDSDSDGVPDFVEIAFDLDPDGSLDPDGEPSDYDGDGFSDLEELIAIPVTDPSNPNSHPATHADGPDTLNLEITVCGYDGFLPGNALADAGMNLQVFDVFGTLLGSAETGAANVLVRCNGVDPDQKFLILSTEYNFPIDTANPDDEIGREVTALVKLPQIGPIEVPFDYEGTAPASRVASWRVAARNAYAARPLIAVKADWQSTLRMLLVEKMLNTPLGYSSTNSVSFTPFRGHEDPEFFLHTSPAQLTALERPGGVSGQAYKLSSLCQIVDDALATPSTNIQKLIDIAREVYSASSRLANPTPGTYPLPIDTLREMLTISTLDPDYVAAIPQSFSDVSDARAAANLLAASASPRPSDTFDLKVVAPDGTNFTRATDVPGTTSYTLLDHEALPYELPDVFQLEPGSCYRVTAYTDLPATGGSDASLEIISAQLLSIPLATADDLDGSLLPDAWERFFFGYGSQDWRSSQDGSGYPLIQEYLAGTDPTDPSSSPSEPAADFDLDDVAINENAEGTFKFSWTWPTGFEDHFEFGVVASDELEAYGEIPAIVADDANGNFTATITPGADMRKFYKVFVHLK